mmetsp:Transcript_28828/g.67619  ORF Transcript_28828/g.67619 Transcript_28828/m.67619 type:complete len:118 (+) Transcript_28828:425-778(+)
MTRADVSLGDVSPKSSKRVLEVELVLHHESTEDKWVFGMSLFRGLVVGQASSKFGMSESATISAEHFFVEGLGGSLKDGGVFVKFKKTKQHVIIYEHIVALQNLVVGVDWASVSPGE